MAEVLFLELQVLVPFCEALLTSCICVNGCFASCLKVKGMLRKECKGEQGIGGEGRTRMPWETECKGGGGGGNNNSQSLFLLQECKFINIYIFRSWNVVVTY